MATESGNKAKAGKALAALPEIPEKQYFSISEAAELCGVKAHVLRYWEQEFPQLKPLKRRGNRRYYQKNDLLLVRQIRTLLYGEGFTIHGARERIGYRSSSSAQETTSQLLLDIEQRAEPVQSALQTWEQRLLFLRQEVEALRRLCAGQ